MLAVALSVAAAAPPSADAQELSSVGVDAAGLVSFQPVDGFYVGPAGPYLDRGLGGFGPGLSLGVNLVAKRLGLTLEYSTAWLSVEQSGRLVSGGTGVGRLRDSMITALAGIRVGQGRTDTQWLAGMSYVAGTPSSNDVPRSGPDGTPFRGVFTCGVDIITAITSTVNLLVTGRVYPQLERSESARQLGVGRDVFRVGIGVRLSVSKG